MGDDQVVAATRAAWARLDPMRFGDAPRPSDSVEWAAYDWTGSRVSGRLVADLVRGAAADGVSGAHVIGAAIEGDVVLAGADLPERLVLERCLLDGKLQLADASGKVVQVRDSELVGGVDADRLRADTLTITRSHCRGRVSVSAAQLGRLDLGGTRVLVEPDDVAVDANVLTATRSVNLNRSFAAIGSVRFIGASVGGQLVLRSAWFHAGPERAAVSLHETTIGRALYLRDSTFDGRVNVSGAHIGGRLDARFATFRCLADRESLALDLNGATISRALQMDEVKAHGMVRARGARIGTQMLLSGAHLEPSPTFGDSDTADGRITGEPTEDTPGGARSRRGGHDVQAGAPLPCPGLALDMGGAHMGSLVLERAVVTGDLLLRDLRIDGPLTAVDMEIRAGPTAGPRTSAPLVDLEGTIVSSVFRWRGVEAAQADLRACHLAVQRLDDDRRSWTAAHLDLGGFTYGSLPLDDGEWSLKERCAWLGRQTSFDRRPYDEFARALAAAGRTEDARTVGMEREMRRRTQLSWRRRWVNRAAFAFNGHGYRPGRTVLHLIGVIALGAGLYHTAFTDGALASEKRCPTQMPCFNALIVSADAALPLIDLGYGEWNVRQGGSGWRAWDALAVLHVGAGWTFATLAAATYTRRAIRE